MTPLLEQQELVEPTPERRWTGPPIATAWWGIDVSTRRYSIAYVDEGGKRGAASVLLGAPNDNEGERLSRFARQLRTLINAMLDEDLPAPAVIFVEQPGGATVMPVLWYAAGIATQVAYEVIRDRLGYVPRVETMPPMRWKKIAVGRGNISKPKRSSDEYPVETWARDVLGVEVASWDEADACGIAEAARKSIAICR